MSNTLKILIVLLLAAASVRLLFAIWKNYGPAPSMAHAQPLPETQAPAKPKIRVKPTEKPYIEISPKARALLLEKLKTIKQQDSAEYVLAQLGHPRTDAGTISASEKIPVSVGSKVLVYQIRKQYADEFDELDEHIYIFLDNKDRVALIYTTLRPEN